MQCQTLSSFLTPPLYFQFSKPEEKYIDRLVSIYSFAFIHLCQQLSFVLFAVWWDHYLFRPFQLIQCNFCNPLHQRKSDYTWRKLKPLFLFDVLLIVSYNLFAVILHIVRPKMWMEQQTRIFMGNSWRDMIKMETISMGGGLYCFLQQNDTHLL